MNVEGEVAADEACRMVRHMGSVRVSKVRGMNGL